MSDPYSDVDVLYQQALNQLNANAFQAALVGCRQAIELAPQRADIWTTLSEIYLEVGESEKALTAAQKAIDLNDQWAHAYYMRGRTRGNLSDYDGEIADAEKAYGLDNSQPSLYYRRLSRAFAAKEDYAYALTYCRMVLVYEPNNIHVLVNRSGLYLALQQFTAARLDLEKVITLSPDWFVPHHALGLTYVKTKEFWRAANEFSKALQAEPGNTWYPVILACRAYTYEMLGMNDEAQRDWAEARALNPDIKLSEAFYPPP